MRSCPDLGAHARRVPTAAETAGRSPDGPSSSPTVAFAGPGCASSTVVVAGRAVAPMGRAHAIAKRTLDIVLSLAGLLAVAPLMALIAAAVKWDSPGPVLYESPRWGQFGRQMRILKFRTMTTGAAERLEHDPALRAAYDRAMKLDDDPRLTRVGRFLRRWSLDELPQLLDVLAGRMSLVGPRPKLLDERERFGSAFEPVLRVPPGLTGLWQVSGRSRTTYEERVALDLAQAADPSLLDDLRILLKTIPVVIRGDGAK